MYNLGNNTVIDTGAEFDNSKKSTFIDIGIHENVEVESVRFGISENNNKFLAITYLDENGNKLTRTEWEPKGDDATKTASKAETQSRRLEQFLYTFISRDTKIQATSFADLATKFVAALGNSFRGTKIRLKVVYDKKNWTNTPEYGKYAWIEPMTVAVDKSKIRILTIDKMAKDPTVVNNTSTATKPKEELPF